MSDAFELRVPCVECREALVARLPIDKTAIADLTDEHLWHLTVLTPPGQGEVPIVLGLLCPSCAKKVYPPELLKAAAERRARRRPS